MQRSDLLVASKILVEKGGRCLYIGELRGKVFRLDFLSDLGLIVHLMYNLFRPN